MSFTDANVNTIEELLKLDRHVTINEICGKLQISDDSLQKIITDTLGFRKVSARWVPFLLTEKQKNHCMKICQHHLNRHNKDGDNVLELNVICDEA